jgi:8-oxo-dGTP diphosphatase
MPARPVVATLCLIRANGKLLLQRRAAGRVGAGRLNGPGGGLLPGESPEAGVAREGAEEPGIEILAPVHHGAIDLLFAPPGGATVRVHVYSCTEFRGRPRGGREGRLRWYPEARLPVAEMWSDMRYWLPVVLDGGQVEGTCTFDESGETMLACDLRLSWTRRPRAAIAR